MKDQEQYQVSLNYEVKAAYFKIIKRAKRLIATLEEEPLRGILVRQDEPKSVGGHIVHEMINVILYLRLECTLDNIFTIHYGYEQSEALTKYYQITSAFIRLIYSYTSKENTKINIENCVYTDWVIINCAELFEYISDRNKYHTYTQIKYRENANLANLPLKAA